MLHIDLVTGAEGLKGSLFVSPSLLKQIGNKWAEAVPPFTHPFRLRLDEGFNVSLVFTLKDMDTGKWLSYKVHHLEIVPGPEPYEADDQEEYSARNGPLLP